VGNNLSQKINYFRSGKIVRGKSIFERRRKKAIADLENKMLRF